MALNAEINAETKGQKAKSSHFSEQTWPPPGDPRQLTQIVASWKATDVVKFIAHPDKAVSCLPWCDSNLSLTLRLKVSTCSRLLLKVRSCLWEHTHLSLKCVYKFSLCLRVCLCISSFPSAFCMPFHEGVNGLLLWILSPCFVLTTDTKAVRLQHARSLLSPVNTKASTSVVPNLPNAVSLWSGSSCCGDPSQKVIFFEIL